MHRNHVAIACLALLFAWGTVGADEDGPDGADAPADRAGGVFRSRGTPRPSRHTNAWSARAQRAVELGLRWLAAHQSADGRWEAAGFPRWCDGAEQPDTAPHLQGPGKPVYDVGVTGLALNAFVSAGYTNRGRHPYAKVVSKGLRYLKNVQDKEGCFGTRRTQQYVYNHALAALAMVEVYGMTGSPLFKGSAQIALDFIARCRNPYFAWRYGVKPGDNDTSVSIWMFLVLDSARQIIADAQEQGREAPLTIDDSASDGFHAWLTKMTDPETGRVGYVARGSGSCRPTALVDRFPGAKSEALTAAGVFGRVLLGEHPRKLGPARSGLGLIQKLPPVWNRADGSIDMMYWHWGSLAAWQGGARVWRVWHLAMDKAIVHTQRKDTDACAYRGSWDPIDPWGPDGGRVYATAMMTLSLQAPHRYARRFAFR